MRKPLALALALGAALHTVSALAACGAGNAAFPAQASAALLPVSVDLNDDRILLGRHGERIASRRTPIWVSDSGDTTPRTWLDNVDWPAYRVSAAREASAPTRLEFDADGRLCSVASYAPQRRAAGGGARLPAEGVVLHYDAAGLLSGYTRYRATDDAAPASYDIDGQACLVRNPEGAVTAFIDAPCANAGTTSPGVHYVRDSAGQLLRAIDTRPSGQPRSVQTFDGQGQPQRRYVQQMSGYGDPSESQGPYPYEVLPDQADRIYPVDRAKLAALPNDIPGNEWRIVRIADDVPINKEDMESWDPASQTILAQGVFNPQGDATPSGTQQEQIWQAMHDKPGRVFWYFSPMSRVLLTPVMAPARWQACTDPANTAADACG